jgi:hypothetical protein
MMSADAMLHPISWTQVQERQKDSGGQGVTEIRKCLTHPSDLNLNPINQNVPLCQALISWSQ